MLILASFSSTALCCSEKRNGGWRFPLEEAGTELGGAAGPEGLLGSGEEAYELGFSERNVGTDGCG
jgi:hypothetical protein